MAKRTHQTPPADYDSPWKEVLDHYFPLFLAFFFPKAHADIDWDCGYEMLDKELQQIVREAEVGRRYVDKLVKVWLKSGEERWILVHVEVQMAKDAEFPKRMYVYNYRIFDRYHREVVSLAILGDDDPEWRPNHYEHGLWGCRASLAFPIAKLLDYAPRAEALERDPNPFALVVLAHLKTMETRHNADERHVWKVRLVKGLYNRGMSAGDVRQLFQFIDWIMAVPEELERRFWHEITEYQEEKRMPFVTIAERVGREKGLAEGLLAGIEAILELKFKAEGIELMPEIRELRDHEVLQKVLDAIKTASSPDEVRRVWAPKRRPKKGRQS